MEHKSPMVIFPQAYFEKLSPKWTMVNGQENFAFPSLIVFPAAAGMVGQAKGNECRRKLWPRMRA
jgi:hypothetical protein